MDHVLVYHQHYEALAVKFDSSNTDYLCAVQAGELGLVKAALFIRDHHYLLVLHNVTV